MSDKEFKTLVETYRKTQDKQLKKLSKIAYYIGEKYPNSIDLQYFITDITAMTEPNSWAKNLLTMCEEALKKYE